MKNLIFFDINGTLIERDSRTDLPFSKAISQLLTCEDAMDGINTSARSDQDVFIEVLTNKGLSYTPDLWEKFLRLYLQQLELFKYSDVWRANADAVSFVKELHEAGYLLGLITGELTIGSRYKLSKLGIWEYFKTGGFGEHGLKRFEIASFGLKQAKSTFGLSDQWLNEQPFYVIGDTTLDIKTARHLGAKSIAITTGSNTRDELSAEGPDYLIDRFEELKPLFF